MHKIPEKYTYVSVSVITIVFFVLIGIFFFSIAPCQKCKNFIDNWKGKNKSQILRTFGTPSRIFPTDKQLKDESLNFYRGKTAYRILYYDDIKISFEVRQKDGAVEKVGNEYHYHGKK